NSNIDLRMPLRSCRNYIVVEDSTNLTRDKDTIARLCPSTKQDPGRMSAADYHDGRRPKYRLLSVAADKPYAVLVHPRFDTLEVLSQILFRVIRSRIDDHEHERGKATHCSDIACINCDMEVTEIKWRPNIQ